MHKKILRSRGAKILILFNIILMTFTIDVRAIMGQHETKEKSRVLYISSYSPAFKTFFQQVEGIKDSFEGRYIELDIEFMDTKRFDDEENIRRFYELLKYKIENTKEYDCIIVGDDNGLNFVIENQLELFKEIPIVFLGINDIDRAREASKDEYITGVVEAVSILETIQSAKRINPNAKRIVALTDSTIGGQADLEKYYSYRDSFENIEFDELNLSDLCYNGFVKGLSKIESDTIVILLSAYVDKYGEMMSFDEGLDMILKNVHVPVYHPYSHGIGEGLIGGKVISHYEQGRFAANLAKRILDGESVDQINIIEESPNKYVFDKKVLDKYRIDTKLLPKGSEIINDDTSVIKQYIGYIIAVLVIVLSQYLLIMFLHINIRRRKKIELELRNSEKKLITSNDELIATNEELMASLEEIREQDEKITSLIYSDVVTELNNRFSIFQIIDNVLKTKNHVENSAILFVDVDNFKNINDTYGHDVGDKVLKIIGNKLKKYEADNISIGRFGGDEFLLMIRNKKDMSEINDFAEMIMDVFSEEIIVENNRIFLTTSIGIATFPNHGTSRGELVKKADVALYHAKDSGKNRYAFYNENMNKLIQEKMVLQESIKEGLNKGEFFLNYQPYVDTNTGETMGFEALIRWVSKVHGFVSPFKLITVAEETGFIKEIGEWVMREACLFAKEINEGRDRKLKMSINISAIQLMENGFFERTMAIVKEIGVDPNILCLEMTETILIDSFEKGTDIIERFKREGFGISLDDFGTGYSSLRYFKDLPVTVLKIDKSFIDNIVTSKYDQKLIKSMINIAHYKDVEVISEGVETEEQLRVLKRFNCDTIQGYFFSKPMNAEDTREYLKKIRS